MMKSALKKPQNLGAILIAFCLTWSGLCGAKSRVPDSKSDSSAESFRQALQAENKGDVETAEKLYLQYAEQKAELQDYALFFAASLQARRGATDLAKDNFAKVLELNPNLRLQLESQSRIAEIALANKNYSEAKSLLTKTEKFSRRDNQYSHLIYNLALAERGLKNQKGVCKWIKILYSRYPDAEEIRNWGLALSQNLISGQKAGCVASSDDSRTRIRNLQWAGLEDKAKLEIDELRKERLLPEEEIDKLEIIYQVSQGETSQALEKLVQGYDSGKKQMSFLLNFASVAAKAGETQAAVGAYYKAYKIGGKDKKAREALFQSAFLSYQFQDYDGAFRRFQEFIKVYPTSGLARDAKWHLAWIKYLRHDYDGALISFSSMSLAPRTKVVRRGRKRVVIALPAIRDDRAKYWAAMCFLRKGRYEDARSSFQALASDPLLSYYSIAAQFRLKKLESFLPKASVPAASSVASFEYLTPELESPDGIAPLDEQTHESEETLATSAVTEVTAAPPTERESVAGDAAAPETAAADTAPEEVLRTDFADPKLAKRFDRARTLVGLGLNDWARWELYDIERKTSNKDFLKTLMSEYETVENFDRSSYIGQVDFLEQRAKLGISNAKTLWEHAYPKAFGSFVMSSTKKFEIPFELVWAIMRAESQYRKDIVSPVGALGLMQVMPNTGSKISNLLGEANFKSNTLLVPDSAIKIGSKYLSRLMRKFNGSVPLVAASYNAGPHRVSAWLNTFGDLDIDEFIEHIPYMETRNYTKRVISNFYIYNQLYDKKNSALASLAEPLQVKVSMPTAARESWDE